MAMRIVAKVDGEHVVWTDQSICQHVGTDRGRRSWDDMIRAFIYSLEQMMGVNDWTR